MNEKEHRQNLITKVNLMIRKANSMDGGIKRNKLIYEIDALASFMYYAEYIKLNEYQDLWNKIGLNSDKARRRRTRDVFIELYRNNEQLLNVYKEAYDQRDTHKIKYYDTTINPELMNEMTSEFLKYVDCDSLLKEIKENGMFKRGSHHIDEGICVDNMGLSYIVLGSLKKDKIEYYTNLIHEMGHAYTNRIVQDNKFGYYDAEIYREFIALTFVRMFLEFLKVNKVLPNNKIDGIISNNETIGYYNLFLAIKFCQKVQENKQLKEAEFFKYYQVIDGHNVTPFIHHYALGYLTSLKLMDDFLANEDEFIIDLPYIIREISCMSLEHIINEVTIEGKNQVYQKQINRK